MWRNPQDPEKGLVLLTGPGTTSVCGSFHFNVLSQQAATHKSTKEAGAGEKEVLPFKKPHILAGGLSLTLDGFWRPVWPDSDFGSKQGKGSPINFLASFWQLLHISSMSAPGSDLGQELVAVESQS